MAIPFPPVEEIIEFAKSHDKRFIYNIVASGNRHCGMGMLFVMLNLQPETTGNQFYPIAKHYGITEREVLIAALAFDGRQARCSNYVAIEPHLAEYRDYGNALREAALAAGLL